MLFLFKDPFHMPVLSLGYSYLEHVVRKIQEACLGSVGKNVVIH